MIYPAQAGGSASLSQLAAQRCGSNAELASLGESSERDWFLGTPFSSSDGSETNAGEGPRGASNPATAVSARDSPFASSDDSTGRASVPNLRAMGMSLRTG